MSLKHGNNKNDGAPDGWIATEWQVRLVVLDVVLLRVTRDKLKWDDK
jgi:hypothetical protein